MSEVILGPSTEGMVVVRHQRCSCFVVGEPVFGVVALGKYEANGSEAVRED